jgi:DeoR/GlpR family transcriptional regulator of sugar metabolism
MLGHERRRLLLELIREKGSVLITDLEKKLAVSRMTVYRDLDALEQEGLVRKVHGGVIAVERDPSPVELRARPFEERLVVARAAKRAIGKQLLQMIEGARTLVLDNSSTVYCLAELLVEGGGGEDLFIVTGSVPMYLEMRRPGARGLRIAMHGGEPHPRTGSLVGPLALGSLREMRFDWAIVSALGYMRDERAVFVSNPEEGEVKRMYLERARRRVLAIDSSKIGQAGPYKLADLDEFDAVVTEDGIEWVRPEAQVARGRR